VDKRVSEQSFEELRSFEAGQWGKWKGKGFCERLPTLDEVLDTVPESRKLYLHGYCDAKCIPQLQAILARSYTKPQQVLFISFNLRTCKRFKALMANHMAFWLHAYGSNPPSLERLVEKANAAKVDGLGLSSEFPIDKAFVRKVHNAGLELHVWTVDDAVEARRLVLAGVDSITTNRPGWLKRQCKRVTY
jgi:glycerophosphoryl diester phosphodiesterase